MLIPHAADSHLGLCIRDVTGECVEPAFAEDGLLRSAIVDRFQ